MVTIIGVYMDVVIPRQRINFVYSYVSDNVR